MKKTTIFFWRYWLKWQKRQIGFAIVTPSLEHIKGPGLVFVVDANYQYDKADDEQGNREIKTDTTPPPAGQAGTTNYTYDDANQLTNKQRTTNN